MTEQQNINYKRIADAIEYIKTNFKEQPNLDEVAKKVHLSPFHFQRLFSEWAGTSPKKFLQFTTVEYAKKLLKDNQATLFETAHETGLSGTGRLHDLFINIEGMTPAEYKNGGKDLAINYSFAESPFGNILVASTEKGICYMAFTDDEPVAFSTMQNHFPNAHFRQIIDLIQQNALYIFTHDIPVTPRFREERFSTAWPGCCWHGGYSPSCVFSGQQRRSSAASPPSCNHLPPDLRLPSPVYRPGLG